MALKFCLRIATAMLLDIASLIAQPPSGAAVQSPSGASSPVGSEKAAATQILNDYYKAFSTLDVAAVLPYFHEPTLIIGPQGVFAALNRSLIAAAFAPAMKALRERGFARSELEIRDIRPLSPTALTATGVAIRYKVDGSVLERVGVTYVLYRTTRSWEIAVLITHDTNETEPDKQE